SHRTSPGSVRRCVTGRDRGSGAERRGPGWITPDVNEVCCPCGSTGTTYDSLVVGHPIGHGSRAAYRRRGAVTGPRTRFTPSPARSATRSSDTLWGTPYGWICRVQ